MSEENVELVRRLYADFGLSPRLVEAAAHAGLIAADAVFDYSALFPDGRVVRGVEAWGRYADSLPWGRSLKVAPERIFDVDDERVLVFVRARAEGEGSGAAVEGRTAAELTVSDGVIVRVKLYKDRTEALEAAGVWKYGGKRARHSLFRDRLS
jgi:ketosteroid isomerase-like protein